MFNQTLEKIVSNCAGGVGAVLMGYDGIGIEQFTADESSLDLNLVGIEYSNVTKEIRNAVEVLKLGDLQEMTVKTEHYYVIIRSLTEDYFVALVLRRSGNFGQGRYLLMREEGELRRLLA